MSNLEIDIKKTEDLCKKINLDENVLTKTQKDFLNEEGYLIIPPTDFIKKNLNYLNQISKKLIDSEGINGGWEGKEQNKNYGKGIPFEPGTNRLGNLIEKHSFFRELLLLPEVITAAKEVIKSDIKLSGFTLRNPLKDNGHQAYHIDGLPRKNEYDPFHGVLCAIFLDDSTTENGSTRIIPKSHKKLGYPDEYIDPNHSQKNEIRANLKAGSMLILNINTWHAGSKNLDGKPRKSIFIQIKRRDEAQLLNYKKYLKKSTLKELSSPLKYLLAVRDNDPTQEEMSIGPGAEYRKKFGK